MNDTRAADVVILHELRAAITDKASMSEPTVLASGAAGFVQLVRGARTRRALDAKFVPTGPIPEKVTHLTSWSSHIAWAVQCTETRRSHQAWDLFLSPCFLGGDPLQIPPAHTAHEATARAWLTLLSAAWLRLLAAHPRHL